MTAGKQRLASLTSFPPSPPNTAERASPNANTSMLPFTPTPTHYPSPKGRQRLLETQIQNHVIVFTASLLGLTVPRLSRAPTWTLTTCSGFNTTAHPNTGHTPS